MPGIRLGILSDEKLDFQFVVSLMRLADARGITKALFANGDVGRLDQGRNVVAKAFLETDAEWLLWIDTDMVFEPQHLDQLLAHKQPIVSGLYYRASDPPTPCMMRYKDKQARVVKDWPKKKLIAVDTAGFGFMLTHRDVLEKIASKRFSPTHPWFDNAQAGPGGQSLADDSSFCVRAALCGYQVLVDTSVRIGHIKQAVLYG